MGAWRLFSAECAQRRQAGHEVKELGGQTFHGSELVLGSRLRETPDQNHEDGNQGDDDECDQRRPEVEEENHAQSCRGHGADEDQLRQEGDEIGTQVFESSRQESRRLRTVRRPPARAQRDAGIDNATAQFTDSRSRRARADRLTGSNDKSATGENARDSADGRENIAQGRPS